MKSRFLFAFDIDQCIADGTLRHQKAGPEPDRNTDVKAHDIWVRTVMSNTETDRAVPEMMLLLRKLIADNVYTPVILVTSRNTLLRHETIDWLKRVAQIGIMPPLMMRGATDKRKAGI